MRLVASSKHHKATGAIERFSQFQNTLLRILYDFTEYCSREEIAVKMPYMAAVNNDSKVAVIAVSSNMSLCGAFNENVARKLNDVLAEYQKDGKDAMLVPIGSHIVKKMSSYHDIYPEQLNSMVKNVNYNECVALSDKLIEMFDKGEISKVELVYNHCKSTASQIVVRETFLPFDVESLSKQFEICGISHDDTKDNYYPLYTIEPSVQIMAETLIPKLMRLKIYTMLLDSVAAEHSARMMAMQIATDNADKLLQSLKIQYNKQRQQAITNELLDIMGGIANR